MIAQHIEVLIPISPLAKENVEVRGVAQWLTEFSVMFDLQHTQSNASYASDTESRMTFNQKKTLIYRYSSS